MIAVARQAPTVAGLLAKKGRPDKILYYGLSPGDDLLCTAVFEELHRRNAGKLWAMTAHPFLFENNPSVSAILPNRWEVEKFIRNSGLNVAKIDYNHFDPETDTDVIEDRHIIASMCASVGITGEISLKPYLNLNLQETENSNFPRGMICIQSSGLNSMMSMKNKQWIPERYQGIIEALKSKYRFVQIGSSLDPPLNDAIDLRGKTTIKESAIILKNSLMYVGNVGFLMHLSRAVGTRSVIIYGGRERPDQSGYPCNVNLYSKLACSPCWKRNQCHIDRECMKLIHPNHVIEGIETVFLKNSEPLEVNTCLL